MKRTVLFYFAFLASTVIVAQNDTDCWKMLRAGSGHAMAIKGDGTLFTWGSDNFAQLGNGFGTSPKTSPTQVANSGQFQFIAAGTQHSMAIHNAGTLYGWGQNNLGQTGIGNDAAAIHVPTQIGTENDWAAVFPADIHTIGLKTSGTLWGWGSNFNGQLSNEVVTQQLERLQIGTDTDWQTVAAANKFTLALKTNGTIWAWGANADGQLGNGTTVSSNMPAQIGTDTDWQKIAAADNHALALKTNGTLWAWGSNVAGKLGNGTTVSSPVPIQIGTDSDWVFINAETNYSIAIKSNGTLWAWGIRTNGVMGNNTSSGNQPVPTQIGTDTNWKAVSGGFSHVMAFKTDGSLWAWGSNLHGQFGNGTNSNSLVPILISCGVMHVDENKTESWSVYPNPSKNNFYLETSKMASDTELTVLDMGGRIIVSSKYKPEQSFIDLSSFENGIYLLQISQAGKTETKKLIKN